MPSLAMLFCSLWKIEDLLSCQRLQTDRMSVYETRAEELSLLKGGDRLVRAKAFALQD
jgi:hypothetical protein